MAQESEPEWELDPLTDEDVEQAKERITEAFDEARAWITEGDERDEE